MVETMKRTVYCRPNIVIDKNHAICYNTQIQKRRLGKLTDSSYKKMGKFLVTKTGKFLFWITKMILVSKMSKNQKQQYQYRYGLPLTTDFK